MVWTNLLKNTLKGYKKDKHFLVDKRRTIKKARLNWFSGLYLEEI